MHLWLFVCRARRRRRRRCSTSSRCCGIRSSDTELARQAANDEARAAELRAEAARLRATVDAKQIETRVARGAPGQRADRSPDVLLDRAVERVRSDAAAQRPHHVVPAADRSQARQRRQHHDRGARRGRRPAVHGEPGEDRRVSRAVPAVRTHQRAGTARDRHRSRVCPASGAKPAAPEAAGGPAR